MRTLLPANERENLRKYEQKRNKDKTSIESDTKYKYFPAFFFNFV